MNCELCPHEFSLRSIADILDRPHKGAFLHAPSGAIHGASQFMTAGQFMRQRRNSGHTAGVPLFFGIRGLKPEFLAESRIQFFEDLRVLDGDVL